MRWRGSFDAGSALMLAKKEQTWKAKLFSISPSLNSQFLSLAVAASLYQLLEMSFQHKAPSLSLRDDVNKELKHFLIILHYILNQHTNIEVTRCLQLHVLKLADCGFECSTGWLVGEWTPATKVSPLVSLWLFLEAPGWLPTSSSGHIGGEALCHSGTCWPRHWLLHPGLCTLPHAR